MDISVAQVLKSATRNKRRRFAGLSLQAGSTHGSTLTARRLLALGLLLLAILAGARALWLPAKAELAQWLLQRSWQSHLHDGGAHRPWPWADTTAIARLRQTRLGIDQIVLAGDSGRVLAFGPGWAAASAAPQARHGNIVISGHRDTHFAWLRNLRPGDFVELQSRQGWRVYRASSFTVVDAATQQLALEDDTHALQLVTCWPFDALATQGSQRLLIKLEPVPALASR
ncbi:MAG TPA: class GN sortase [Arenimonas sp.]|nr:class GN sortase [Arenimonas sp.]